MRTSKPALLVLPSLALALGACTWLVLWEGAGSPERDGDGVTGSTRSPASPAGIPPATAPDLTPTRAPLPEAPPAPPLDLPPFLVHEPPVMGDRRGRVLRAEDGGPVAGARVVMERKVRGCRFPGLEPPPVVLVTDADGSFPIPESGGWDVTVRASGRVSLSGSLILRDGELLASPDDAVFALPEGELLRGRVVGSAGIPPAGTDVIVEFLAERPEGIVWLSGSTDANGWFQVGPVPMDRPFVIAVCQWDTPPFRSLPVILEQRDPGAGPITVPWEHFTSVDVMVTDARGEPPEELWLHLEPLGSRQAFQEDEWGKTDEGGRVTLAGLFPGPHELVVEHWVTEEVLYRERIVVPDQPSTHRVRLPVVVPSLAARAEEAPAAWAGPEPGEEPDREWVEVPVGARFEDSGGRPLEVRIVSLEIVDGEVCAGFDEVVPAEPDEARETNLDAQDPEAAAVLVDAPGHAPSLVPMARVAAGGTVRLGSGRTLRGVLRTASGQPVPWFPVEAIPEVLFRAEGDFDGGFCARARTDGEGRFELPHQFTGQLCFRLGSESHGAWVLDEKVLPAGAEDLDLGVWIAPGW